MSGVVQHRDRQELYQHIDRAAAGGLLSPGAVANLRLWLDDPRYADYALDVAAHIERGQWKVLDDVFWTVIPFGTGGRRGKMYPIGSNAINDRTIGESAQGLATYIRRIRPHGSKSCAIAYDTRHRSRHFAELSAGIMAANGFHVYFIDDYRSTPELSFLVRHRLCDCGIMVTASHNPPSDNAVKVYGPGGGQLVPPHDQGVIDEVMRVERIRHIDFAGAVRDGLITLCREEIDAALLECHLEHATPGPRDLRVLYSPMHGVGEFNTCALLRAAGFAHVEVFAPHRAPDGDFPNVPGHVANPENPAVFDAMIERARATGADLILATDPDCDRMGAASRTASAPANRAPGHSLSGGEADGWRVLSGNQLSALLADYVLDQRRRSGPLSPDDYLVTTLVTTRLVGRIAASYGVRCIADNLVGFKWIGDTIDRQGPDHFVYGTEESHGFLVGNYARDKDGAIACLLMCQLAAQCKAQGTTVHGRLEDLYRLHGQHEERLINITLPGSDGMRRMNAMMQQLRQSGCGRLGNLAVVRQLDYLHHTVRKRDGSERPLPGPTGDLIFLETEADGNYAAIRPSGTEPKVKMYLFAYAPPGTGDPASIRESLRRRLEEWGADLQRFADGIA